MYQPSFRPESAISTPTPQKLKD